MRRPAGKTLPLERDEETGHHDRIANALALGACGSGRMTVGQVARTIEE